MNNSKSDIILDNVVQDLFSTIPLIFRSIRIKLLKRAVIQFDKDFSPPHFEIMRLLERTGTLRMSEIGDRLHISRPRMTILIDKLIKLGLAERQMDMADRRTINVNLTDEGRTFFKDHEKEVKEAAMEALSPLNIGELRDLSTSLRTLQKIFAKLE